MEKEKKPCPRCMICGSGEHLFREAGICLCSRCICALGRALAKKLGLSAPPDEVPVPPPWEGR